MLLIEANATDEIDAPIMHAHYLPACYLKGFIDPASEVERDTARKRRRAHSPQDSER
jgi:hypothetical protein